MTKNKEFIILVEDDKDQLAWAKQELTGENLIVFETVVEWEQWFMADEKYKTIDSWYLITDCFLPFDKESETTTHAGIGIFADITEHVLNGYAHPPLGAAIVSNMEHHKQFSDKDREATEHFDTLFGRFTEFYLEPKNLHAYMDVVHYAKDYYSHVLLDGEIVEKDGYNWREGKLLKPYRKILDTMRKGVIQK